MKFAKELEQDLVPEWRVKYLNYKAGKKYVKAVARAIHRANGTPALGRRGDVPPHTPNFPVRGLHRLNSVREGEADESSPLRSTPAPLGRGKASASIRGEGTPAQPIPAASGERDALANSSHAGNLMHYGSFVATPPEPSPISTPTERSTFELPAPAIKVPSRTSDAAPRPGMTLRKSIGRLGLYRSVSMQGMGGQPPQPQDNVVGPSGTPVPPRDRLVRIFTTGSQLARRASAVNIGMESFNEVRERERELYAFLDSELDKVETFYKQKEEQAGKRLVELREQLHEMRNRRIEEIAEAKRRKEQGNSHSHSRSNTEEELQNGNGKGIATGWMEPIKDKLFKPGPNSKALAKMARTPVMRPRHGHQSAGPNGDYTRRPADQAVPYRTAKRKLKLALQEFYRGLELLKSYALLNRTAFRKLNKKYDKAVNARPPYRYMNEKVSKAWFVNSDVLDGHINTVEDLYARYFEKGNHKIAAGKLRSFTKGADQSPSAFRSGLLVGIGAVFSIQGLAFGADLLLHAEDPMMRMRTGYLLQIYGGYFLMLYYFALFCLDCRIWTSSKINYPFIFELDLRDHLDWRQVAEFPSFFLLLFGLFMWLNFSQYGSPDMYLYYPVILIGWRLFFAGLYPVEFRDFFLGDIYCSLTYAMSNIELFFCLYATYWGDPEQCNSSHSRLLGFFSTLPAIWRALQCIRRYYDTRNVFPHLVNCGKYAMTITAAVCLSLYRLENTQTKLAVFITFSTINGIYTSIWDIFMDFSLLQSHSRQPFLRDVTAFRQKWAYYTIMILDPLLRFSWIFYAIFTHDTQHSTICSFLVAFAEVTRRGMWTLFRVENEHCTNVASYRASRDVPLPYHLEPMLDQRPSLEADAIHGEGHGGSMEPDEAAAAVAGLTPRSTARSTGVDRPSAPATPVTEQTPQGMELEGTVRRRRADTIGRKSIAKIMADAHRQDFEKRRKPTGLGGGDDSGGRRKSAVSEEEEERDVDDGGLRMDYEEEEDDDDDDETGSMLEERIQVREAEGFVRRAGGGRGDESD
ncbi:EXS family protein [Coniochaeta sp. 2T2.1]|nr:EXS family protein [Coniochaeta sp. 2T2.1]